MKDYEHTDDKGRHLSVSEWPGDYVWIQADQGNAIAGCATSPRQLRELARHALEAAQEIDGREIGIGVSAWGSWYVKAGTPAVTSREYPDLSERPSQEPAQASQPSDVLPHQETDSKPSRPSQRLSDLSLRLSLLEERFEELENDRGYWDQKVSETLDMIREVLQTMSQNVKDLHERVKTLEDY